MHKPNRVFVKPKSPGLKVRYPEFKRHLKDKGETVELNPYWVRRQEQGDVTISSEVPVRKKRKAGGEKQDGNKSHTADPV